MDDKIHVKKNIAYGLSIALLILLAFGAAKFYKNSKDFDTKIKTNSENQRIIDSLNYLLAIIQQQDSNLVNDNLLAANEITKNFSGYDQTNPFIANRMKLLDYITKSRTQNNLPTNEILSIDNNKFDNQRTIIKSGNENQNIISKLEQLLNRSQKEKDSLLNSIMDKNVTINDQNLLNEITKVIPLVNGKGNEIYYIGEKKEGKANGYGVGLWKKGGRYEGLWINNNRHGQGKYYWADGEFYDGEFLMDKREGFGKYVWKNGGYFIGYWKADQRHGEGILYEKNGKVRLQGTWSNDQYVKNSK